MAKQILFQEEARQAVLRGMQKVADAVGATLGPCGQTVILGRPVGPALVTKDGVTVARTISLPDPWENEGAKLIQEVAQRTNQEAGDGTTAATVLTHAIFKEGVRQITAGADPQTIERGIRQAVEMVVEGLRKLAVPVEQSDVGRLSAVATIAANGDEEMGKVIGRAISHAGVEGNYSLDPSPTSETTLEIADGLQFDRGLIRPNFMTDAAHGVTVFDACNIFVTDRRLIDDKQMTAILQMYFEKGRSVPLLIIAEDIEQGALQILTVNHGKTLKLCPVRTPGTGPSKKDEIEDIAVLTGAKPYMVANGDDPGKLKFEDLGSADRVIVNLHRTTIVGGHGSKAVLEVRKDELRSRIKDPETKEFVRAQLERRLAGLSASIAVIKLGSLVDAKLKEKRDRAEDSLNATVGALMEGIVPGGGTALVRCLPALEAHIPSLDGDLRVGHQIVAAALSAPMHRLVQNSGRSGDVYVEMTKNDRKRRGYNAASGQFENLVKSGVVDPVKVIRLALQNSAEMAGLLLTSAGLVVDLPDPQRPRPERPGGAQ